MWGGPSSAARRPRTRRRASAVACRSASDARPKSAACVRGTIQASNGEREAYGAKATLDASDHRSRSGRGDLVADEPAERALPFPDHEAGRAADLLGHPMRDLGQVVEVEAQVVGPGTGLGAPVLDDLDIGGLAGPHRLGDRVAADPEHRPDHLVADGLERPVLAGWRDDGPPAARRPGLLDRDLDEVPVELAGLGLGPDDVEREILEDPQPDAVALGLAAVLAAVLLLDRSAPPGRTGRDGRPDRRWSRPTSR